MNSNKSFADKTKIRMKVINQVRYALATGKLKKGPCSVCGQVEGIQAHHEDYTKPLDVIWLCGPHHKRIHKDDPQHRKFKMSKCPNCNIKNAVKSGMKFTRKGKMQRYRCNDCGRTFLEVSNEKSPV